MSRNYVPRDNVARPFEGYPAYGAVHEVLPTSELRSFLNNFANIADKVFDTSSDYLDFEPEIDDGSDVSVKEPAYDSRKFYRTFNPETLGVSVVEMDPSAKAARTIRALWEKQDFGQVEQEAKDEIHKHLGIVEPRMVFDSIMGVGGRLPNVPKTDLRQKLALVPDVEAYPETIELITEEAEIVIGGIARRLKQFFYPWDIAPHLTFAVFKKEAAPDQIKRVVQETKAYIGNNPLAVRMAPISFRYSSKR